MGPITESQWWCLLTPFVEIHREQRKNGRRPLDPYHTYESYLATIIHEFGHVYYNQHKLWYYSDKAENTGYMRLALDLYQGEAITDLSKVGLKFPTYKGIAEIFAFCTDYTAAKLFWPNHKKDIDKEAISRLRNLIEKEGNLNLDTQDSVLAEPHNLAVVLGKIIVEKYSKNWSDFLLNPQEYRIPPK